jgi:hypothetical protein
MSKLSSKPWDVTMSPNGTRQPDEQKSTGFAASIQHAATNSATIGDLLFGDKTSSWKFSN